MNTNENDIKSVQLSFLRNVSLAVEFHCKTLQSGAKHDLVSVFRAVALWFDNESYEEIHSLIPVWMASVSARMSPLAVSVLY